MTEKMSMRPRGQSTGKPHKATFKSYLQENITEPGYAASGNNGVHRSGGGGGSSSNSSSAPHPADGASIEDDDHQIAVDGLPNDVVEGGGFESLEEGYEETQLEVLLEPVLLRGEVVRHRAENVLKYANFSGFKHGCSGVLYLTNFRIAFVTSENFGTAQTHQKNKLFGDHDIPLGRVDGVFQLGSTSTTRKRLRGKVAASHKIKALQIYCKDFEIHTFSFKFARERFLVNEFVNALAQAVAPEKPQYELLFAFAYRTPPDHVEDTEGTRTFHEAKDLDHELHRLHCANLWRVTHVNRNFRLSALLPQYFVIPRHMVDHAWERLAGFFTGGNAIQWNYTHSNGCSLVTMSTVNEEKEKQRQQPDEVIPVWEAIAREGEKKQPSECIVRVKEVVKRTHPALSVPVIVDLDECLVSVRDMAVSFERLKDLCMPSSEEELKTQDPTWFSSVQNTQWLQGVRMSLTAAFEVSQWLVTRKKSVIIRESNGARDLAPLVSSLVHLMLDPHSRTIAGFQTLVEKEWVAKGHRFLERLGVMGVRESEAESPVFLHFLDCAWQLCRQFPSQFEFSEIYLASVIDATHLGLFENFVFASEHQRVRTIQSFEKERRPFRAPSVWDWGTQFTDSDFALFKNPLYAVKDHLPKHSIRDILHTDLAAVPNNNFQIPPRQERKKFCRDGLLFPHVGAPHVHLWSLCYLRWITPLEIVAGGTPSEYRLQSMYAEEIVCLQHKIQCLETTAAAASSSSAAGSGGGSGPSGAQTYISNAPNPFLRSERQWTSSNASSATSQQQQHNSSGGASSTQPQQTQQQPQSFKQHSSSASRRAMTSSASSATIAPSSNSSHARQHQQRQQQHHSGGGGSQQQPHQQQQQRNHVATHHPSSTSAGVGPHHTLHHHHQQQQLQQQQLQQPSSQTLTSSFPFSHGSLFHSLTTTDSLSGLSNAAGSSTSGGGGGGGGAAGEEEEEDEDEEDEGDPGMMPLTKYFDSQTTSSSHHHHPHHHHQHHHPHHHHHPRGLHAHEFDSSVGSESGRVSQVSTDFDDVHEDDFQE